MPVEINSYYDTAEKISRRRYCKAIGAAAVVGSLAAALGCTGVGKEVIDTRKKIIESYARNTGVPEVYGQETGTAPPPALMKPYVDDGRYTPLENLQLTPLGEAKVAESSEWMPKDEWSDGDERKLSIFNLKNVPSDYPEAYFRSKFYEDRFSVLVDVVSDKQVNVGDFMNFTFDTKNTGIDNPGTPGVYCLWLRYTNDSPDSLTSTAPLGAALPGNPFPKNTVKFKSSLSSSPHSSENHKLIEAEFDLNLLTKYSKKIGFNFRMSSFLNKEDSGYSSWYMLNYKLAPFESIYFSNETLPITEYPENRYSSIAGLAIATVTVGILSRKLRSKDKITRRGFLLESK